MALFGSIETVRAQVSPNGKFAAAFAYLDDLLRVGSLAGERLNAITAGETQRVELAGGAFALEQAYVTKERADGFFESHRKYIDLQVIVAGEERMEVADRARCTERQAYQPERDLIIYEDVPAASVLTLRAGDVAVFYPDDVHMPSLRGSGERMLVRKTVVKVPVG